MLHLQGYNINSNKMKKEIHKNLFRLSCLVKSFSFLSCFRRIEIAHSSKKRRETEKGKQSGNKLICHHLFSQKHG